VAKIGRKVPLCQGFHLNYHDIRQTHASALHRTSPMHMRFNRVNNCDSKSHQSF
jgi:hypothetical protein